MDFLLLVAYCSLDFFRPTYKFIEAIWNAKEWVNKKMENINEL